MIYPLVIAMALAVFFRKKLIKDLSERNMALLAPAGFFIFTALVFSLKTSSLYADEAGSNAMAAFLTLNISSLARGMEKTFDFIRFVILYFFGFAAFFGVLIFVVKEPSLKRGLINSLILLAALLAAGFFAFI